MAIEASAKKANMTGQEMHDRLKRQGLIHKRLFRHYDQLHTQSLEWVVDDTLETLHNWEQEERGGGNNEDTLSGFIYGSFATFSKGRKAQS